MWYQSIFIFLSVLFLNESQAAIVVGGQGIQGCSSNGGKIKMNFSANAAEPAPFTIKTLNGTTVVSTQQVTSAGQVMINNLPSGNYTVKVSSANGVSGVSGTLNVPAYSPLSISAMINHVYSSISNPSPSTGKIDVTVTGGQVPEVFIWSKGTASTGPFSQIKYQSGGTLASAPDLISLSKGFYRFQIFTINGCSYTKTYELKLNPTAPTTAVSQ